jgi:hypothetical protein
MTRRAIAPVVEVAFDVSFGFCIKERVRPLALSNPKSVIQNRSVMSPPRRTWIITACLSVVLLPLPLLRTVAAEKKEGAKVAHHLPQLTSVFPQGWSRGSTVRLKVLGEFLDRGCAVVFLNSSLHGRVLQGDPSSAELEFEVPADAAFGLHYFRVVTPRGASNLLPFRVGDLPHRLEHEPNNTFEQSEEVPVPVTINGQLNVPNDFDFYRFHAEKGQTWVFDLRATRLANPLDGALILLDSDQHKLAHSEDYFNWDPFLTYTFAETGMYFVVVQPNADKWLDPNFAYQLDIRAAPQLLTISPLALAPGRETEATLFGAGPIRGPAKLWFGERGFEGEVLDVSGSKARVKIRVPSDVREREYKLALVTDGGRSNSILFLVDSRPPHHDGEWIEHPVSAVGTAHYPEPQRLFFQARANQTLDFEVRASRYGSPVDSVLTLLSEKGEKLAENDDAKFPGIPFNKDSEIVYTFKDAGKYELQVRNLWALESDAYPYELVMRPVEPRVQLMLDSDHPYVEAGGTGTLKVTAVRSGGFDAPVRLTVTGLPTSVVAEPAEIPAKASEAEIHFRCHSAAPGTFAEIQIVSDKARGPARVYVHVPQDGVDTSIVTPLDLATLAVTEKPSFSLEAGVQTITLVAGGSAVVPVEIQRTADLQGEIHFSFLHLPAGVSPPKNSSAPTGARYAMIDLVASENAPSARSAHVVLLGVAEDGHMEEAPEISASVE